MKRNLLVIGAVFTLLLTNSHDAKACIDGQSALGATMGRDLICSNTFIQWTWNHFKPRDWSGWGKEDPCNIAMPYGKMELGAFLIAHGLPRDVSREAAVARDGFGANMQFHGRMDYIKLTHFDGDTNAWHKHTILEGGHNDRSKVAFYTNPFAGARRIEMHCPMFDTGGPSDDPIFMAATLIHENWHGWQDKRSIKANNPIDGNNHTKPQPPCTAASCDYFYEHNPVTYSYENLLNYVMPPEGGSAPYEFHTPYQIEIEYDCDLGIYQAVGPGAIASLAVSQANSRMAQTIINPVSFTCGSPGMFSNRKV